MNTQKPHTILVLDDDPVVRSTMAAFLEDEGYVVLEADSGESGLEVFRCAHPDAILLDWRLPGMSGGEVLSRMCEEAPTTPVIIVSGTDRMNDVVDALKRGAWDFLTKPLREFSELSASIQRCLERARLLREEGLRRENLEQQVRKRTEALEEANAMLRRQIAERIEFEKALADSEERFRQLVENVREVFFVRDMNTGAFLYVSPAYAEVWGRSCASLYSDPEGLFSTVHAEDQEKFVQAWDLLQKAHKPFDVEHRIVRPDNTLRWIRGRAFPVEDDRGVPYRIVGIADDITNRKTSEEKIRSSLKEKETLLKEVHHRVKNNLQLVSSLLNLQASYIRTPEDRELFLESQNRIHSMTLVHEELYRSDDLACVEFSDYLPKLTQKLISVFSMGKDIRLVTDIQPIFFPVDTAIPCGLIVNELFSNALKHAFKGRDEGIVCLSVKRDQDNIKIIVRDNGIGFPLDYEPDAARTLGMQLVHSLVDQLGAFLDIEVDTGTTFTITFHAPNRCTLVS
ncbi:response regulator [Desulfovibrio mangrovi]|uniref:sensor histidine kinase n=1 Tax=Desulfovibrio mangrovi TaxID=2976983 RepID=UPI002247BE55|nr:response regulator [Desulfovibrio mangrovi]UZP68857.1 response regulator [Desulfovibrio mangrovi]